MFLLLGKDFIEQNWLIFLLQIQFEKIGILLLMLYNLVRKKYGISAVKSFNRIFLQRKDDCDVPVSKQVETEFYVVELFVCGTGLEDLN